MVQVHAASAHRTDEQLLEILADSATWLIRGGPGGALGIAPNLQSAIVRAFEFSRANEVVQAIVKMPNDSIVIDADQVYRLQRNFRIEDRFGNQVGG